MKIAFIARSTLFEINGGDTIQILNTAKALEQKGVNVSIVKANEQIQYDQFDLLHFFNLTRPADILNHIKASRVPFVLTPIYIDYSEFDKNYRKGISNLLFRFCSANRIEYFKTVARFLNGNDSWPGISYLWKGQKRAMEEILAHCSHLLPGTNIEYQTLKTCFTKLPDHTTVPLAVDSSIFQNTKQDLRNKKVLLCVARIEGIKNQLNLIRAVNNTAYKLLLIGNPAPNQLEYYEECKKIAAPNIEFINHTSQQKLVAYYQEAKVHILPSWFENAGLSTLEAASMGCNVVVSRRGFISEYLGDDGFYCDPSSPASILDAIEKAVNANRSSNLQQRLCNYSWQQAAEKIIEAYKRVLNQ